MIQICYNECFNSDTNIASTILHILLRNVASNFAANPTKTYIKIALFKIILHINLAIWLRLCVLVLLQFSFMIIVQIIKNAAALTLQINTTSILLLTASNAASISSSIATTIHGFKYCCK